MNLQSILFTPIVIGNATIPNRFVRSATQDFMATDEGLITERQISLFRKLAEGEVGLIITGHAYVNPEGKASPRQIGVYDDRSIEGLKRLTDEVHQFPSRIFLLFPVNLKYVLVMVFVAFFAFFFCLHH